MLLAKIYSFQSSENQVGLVFENQCIELLYLVFVIQVNSMFDLDFSSFIDIQYSIQCLFQH